jgi:hypothetical protein
MYSGQPPPIAHNLAASRFELDFDDGLGQCAYRLIDGVVYLTHTEVPPEREGRGHAAALVQAALDWARSQGLRVVPRCSYVAAYMRRHPATHDLLAK